MPTVVKVFRNPKKGDEAAFTLNTQTYEIDADVHDTYVVRYSDGTATPVEAATATDGTTSIPAVGSTYPGTSYVCTSVRPRRRGQESPSIFDVDVEWKNIVPQGSGAKWNINIGVRGIRYEQDAWEDVTVTATPGRGNPVVSSANEFFNPTLKRIFFDEEIEVSFDCDATEAGNVITATGDGVSTGCKGHYNNAAVTLTVNGVARTFDTGTLLYLAPEYSTVYVGSPPYDWKFRLVFQYRRDGWKDKVPDRGTYYCIPGTTQRFRGRDDAGEFVPVLLDGSGGKLAGVTAGTTQLPTLLTFDMYGPADFTSLLSGIS